MSEYGILYMGSKDKIAESISMVFPKADNFYDLFGGGFSITHCMLVNQSHKFKTFHYNEIKSDVADLVKKAIAGDFNYKKFQPKFVSRSEFFLKKDSDAYVRCLWSFGNNQKTYLFSEEIEPYKRSMHQAVVFGEFDDLAFEVFGFRRWPSEAKTIKQRRFWLRQKIEYFRKTKIPKVIEKYLNEKQRKVFYAQGPLPGSIQLQQLQQLQRLEQLQQLERLRQLERLQQLRQLERLQQLTFYSKDYREVEILHSSVVYCDIPYQGTADYGAFNHQEFFDWAASRPFPVYVSEYEIKDPRFKCVYGIDKRSILSGNKDKCKNKSEKVYWNGVK